jgi:hypothetical protein
MPLLHCTCCHHEWEGDIDSKCDWCGGSNYMLEEKTPLTRFLDYLYGEEDEETKTAGNREVQPKL